MHELPIIVNRLYIILLSTQSQGHVEELIGGQSWGVLEVLQLDIPENESLSFFGGDPQRFKFKLA